MRESLLEYGNERIIFRNCVLEFGYIVNTVTFELDLETMNHTLRTTLDELPLQVSEEMRYLSSVRPAAVMSDISAIPIAAAHELGIPTIGLSNFTWYSAYAELFSNEMLQPLYDAYEKMDYFIQYEGVGVNEPNWGRFGQLRANFFSRKPNWAEVDRLRAELDPTSYKTIILFAVGLGVTITDFKDMMIWNDSSCLFVVSSNMNIEGSNVIRIPNTYLETQNYVAASDLVISKPGWGTVSEAVVASKPLVLVDRKQFSEDYNTVDALYRREYPFCRIDWFSLKGISRLNDIQVNPGTTMQLDNEMNLSGISAYIEKIIKEWVE
ncbi:glycosyltransferase [Paenibacillus protaetiae]|uniref:glycosyltransferase n=1 Tax=Paenibacillus protaetiae TaxID=2509456 RepID=UPI001FC94A54|nr:glycosyltransferase [Paenibacillus protaetiae]